MTTPTTEAGKTLVYLPCDCGRNPSYSEAQVPHRPECQSSRNLHLLKPVLAIESEAVAGVVLPFARMLERLLKEKEEK